MVNLTNARRPVLFVGLAFALMLTEWLIIQSSAFTRNPAPLSLAVLFDLSVITSGLFYWLVARNGSAKPTGWTIARTGLVALVMTRVALFILPADALPAALTSPALLALVEGSMLIVAGFRIRTIVRTYRQLRPATDADTALHGGLTDVFGHWAAGLIVGEWLVVRYALLGWRLKIDVPPTAIPLTTHRESGQVALTVTVGMVGLIELMAAHLLLARWNADAAFWITLVSAYGMLIIVADAVATLKRPSYLTADALHLRLGVRWRAVVRRDQIERIEHIHEKPTNGAATLNAAFLTAPNVLITLNEPVLFDGLYGLTKSVRQMALFVDKRRDLLSEFGSNREK